MSTYWGYRCKDCSENSPEWYNHGQEELRAFHRNLPFIRTWYESKDMPWHLELQILGCYEEPDVVEFLLQHEGHALELRNEYGQIEQIECAKSAQDVV